MFLPEQIPLERDESTALLIENARQGEPDQSLEQAHEIIKAFIRIDGETVTSEAMDSDKAAWHTPEIIGALATISREDRQTYTRVRLALKRWKIATDVDNAVKAFLRTSAPKLNPIAAILENIPASNENAPVLEAGSLVRSDDDGRPKRLIESEAAVLVAVALKGYAAFDPELSVWFVFNSRFWDAQDAKRLISGGSECFTMAVMG